jgi:hypothetical protein
MVAFVICKKRDAGFLIKEIFKPIFLVIFYSAQTRAFAM